MADPGIEADRPSWNLTWTAGRRDSESRISGAAVGIGTQAFPSARESWPPVFGPPPFHGFGGGVDENPLKGCPLRSRRSCRSGQAKNGEIVGRPIGRRALPATKGIRG